MKKSLFLLVAMVIATAAGANAATDNPLLDRLQANGFVCAPKGNDGHVCTIQRVRLPNFRYSQPIAILVPKNIQRPKNLSLFFHGWRNGVCAGDQSAEAMADQFQFLKQMRAADPTNSTVMILPTSQAIVHRYRDRQNRPRSRQTLPTFDGLVQPEQFSRFTAWVDSLLQTDSSARYHVSGFSAGGKVMEQVLQKNSGFRNRVSSATLLDGTYSSPNFLDMWKNAAKRMKVYASVTNMSSKTRLGSGFNRLRSSLGKSAPDFGPSCNNATTPCESKNTSHCKVPGVDYGRFLKQALNLKPIREARPIRRQTVDTISI